MVPALPPASPYDGEHKLGDAAVMSADDALGAWEWTNRHPTDTARAWRLRIERGKDVVEHGCTTLGAQSWGRKGAAFPDYFSRRRIVYGLLTVKNDQGESADIDDQKDLARWFGTILAFAHGHGETADLGQRAYGTGPVYKILDLFLEKVAHLAYRGRDIPRWATDQLNAIKRERADDQLALYRPWNEIHKILLIVLQSFSEYTHTPIPCLQETHEAVRGCLALRLLAGSEPGRVSDEVYTHLTWLEQNIRSNVFNNKDVDILRQEIVANWERSVLERGPQGGTHTSKTWEQKASTLPSARRRAL